MLEANESDTELEHGRIGSIMLVLIIIFNQYPVISLVIPVLSWGYFFVC